MAFNYATGQYEPDQPAAQPTSGPTMNDWFRLAGYGQQNPGMDYSQQAGGGGSTPPVLNGGTVDPVTGRPAPPPSNPNGLVLPPGTGPDYTKQPPGQAQSPDNPYVNPGTVLTDQTPGAGQQQSPLQIFSQNAGTTYGNPTLPGDFWSGTAGHYVDPTYGTDATGRVLSDAEKTYWQGYDHARASGTLQTYLATVKNPGLAPGTQATYAPGVQTTTIPGRYLDQTGAPAATNPAATATGAPGQPGATTQANPLDPAWDYSKAGAVPWQAFIKNLFADANAQQSFKELQGVLTPQQVDAASKQFGWQPIVGSAGTDPNVVFRAAIQAAQADPTSDYSVVRMQNPADGTVSLGIMKRPQSVQAQEAAGFYAPGSTNPNSPANQARAAAARNATTNGRTTGGGVKPGGTVTGGGVTPKYTDLQIAQQKSLGALGGAALKAGFNVPWGQYAGTGENSVTNASNPTPSPTWGVNPGPGVAKPVVNPANVPTTAEGKAAYQKILEAIAALGHATGKAVNDNKYK